MYVFIFFGNCLSREIKTEQTRLLVSIFFIGYFLFQSSQYSIVHILVPLEFLEPVFCTQLGLEFQATKSHREGDFSFISRAAPPKMEGNETLTKDILNRRESVQHSGSIDNNTALMLLLWYFIVVNMNENCDTIFLFPEGVRTTAMCPYTWVLYCMCLHWTDSKTGML